MFFKFYKKKKKQKRKMGKASYFYYLFHLGLHKNFLKYLKLIHLLFPKTVNLGLPCKLTLTQLISKCACATPWTITSQAPLSMEFSRQVQWSGLPFSSPGDLPDPGIGPASFASPAWQADYLPLYRLGSPKTIVYIVC